MANLLKTAKRGSDLQRVTNGYVLTSQQYAARTAALTPEIPPLMYCAAVKAKINGGEEYTLQLTEAEMITVTSEWLTMMDRRRIDAEYQARRKARHGSPGQ